MLTKERVISDIKNMPNEFSIDELVERLLFISAIEKGMEQDDKNEVMTTEELKQKLGK
jgi:predicted transcriptional regulator